MLGGAMIATLASDLAAGGGPERPPRSVEPEGAVMAAPGRRLLLDGPLALLVGLLAMMAGRAAGYWAARPGWEERTGPPPWSGPRGSGPSGWDEGAHPGIDLPEPYGWALIIWVLIVMIGIAIRRIRPQAGYALTLVGSTGYLAVGLPLGPVLAGPALGLMALATRLPVRRWVPWAVLLLPMLWAAFITEPYLGLTDPRLYNALFLLGAVTLLPALIATIGRNRRDAGRRAHELELRRATYQERLRIARDVHDVVGHSLSVINMQAGVGLYLLAKHGAGQDSAQLEESLQAIRSSSKNALDELRATLEVFRGESAERAPVAGLDRVPELVQAMRAAGREVDLQVTGELSDIPGSVDVAGYRIVQEALTNVARHTTGAAADVHITRTEGAVIIRVSDDGVGVRPRQRDDPPGQGLLGMAERAEAVGGTVRTGRMPGGGGFGVEAEFPLPDRSTRS
jgi:signal transduction histidine kinase